ncbi:hypothetical protein BDW60DRAFT_205651 [Aspergillus nidulans var. acristatus]
MRFQLKYMDILAVFLPGPPADHRQGSPEHRQRRPRRSSKATGQDHYQLRRRTQTTGPKPTVIATAATIAAMIPRQTVVSPAIPVEHQEAQYASAQECNTDLEVSEYDFANLKRSEGRETVSGVVEWSLPNSAVRVPADKKTFSQNLRRFAQGIYNRLKEEPNERVIAEGGYNLVAVLSKTKAPRLECATNGQRNGEKNHPNEFHAEGGAIYTYEKEKELGSLEDVGLTFPSGAEILVYGRRTLYDKEPRVVPPCEPSNPIPGEIVRSPSCGEVL